MIIINVLFLTIHERRMTICNANHYVQRTLSSLVLFPHVDLENAYIGHRLAFVEGYADKHDIFLFF